VFSGDAGVTFPNGSTTRTGIEWGNTYHINSWLAAELNAAFTRARFDADAAPDDLGAHDRRNTPRSTLRLASKSRTNGSLPSMCSTLPA